MRTRPLLRLTEFRLLLAPSLMTIVGLLTIYLAERGDRHWHWTDIWVSLAYVAVVVAISLSFSLAGFRGDQVLFPLTVTLAALGLLVAQRLSPSLIALGVVNENLAQKQFIYLMLGLAILWGIVLLFHRFDLLRRYKYTWLFLSLGLLAAAFVLGVDVGGARLWLRLGPVQIQPSEIVKITLVIFLAGYLEDKHELIGSSWRLGFLELPPLPYLLPMGLIWGASLLVLVVQNDLGSALLFFGIFLVMLYLASGRSLYVIVGLIAFAVACWLAYLAFSRIGIRVENWLNPWQHPLTTGYQQIESDYALTGGGILGTGLGLGKPFYIPAVQTDFVFSAIGEELGLLGTLTVLALYFLMVMRGFAIALRVRDGFAKLVAAGLSASIALQTLVIVGGVIRLIPLTGITLPFVSYGGSSLLTNFVIVGLLMRISAMPRTEPG